MAAFLIPTRKERSIERKVEEEKVEKEMVLTWTPEQSGGARRNVVRSMKPVCGVAMNFVLAP